MHGDIHTNMEFFLHATTNAGVRSYAKAETGSAMATVWSIPDGIHEHMDKFNLSSGKVKPALFMRFISNCLTENKFGL